MKHWLELVITLLNAGTQDLRELAQMAGADPITFYRGVRIDGLDLRGQDLRGMQFTDLNPARVLIDAATKLDRIYSDRAPDIKDRTAISGAIDQNAKITVNRPTKTVAVDGRKVNLTPREYEILELLLLKKGVVLTQYMLLKQVYGEQDEPEMRTVATSIARVRKKLAAAGAGQTIITIWGRGYLIDDPGDPWFSTEDFSDKRQGRGRKRGRVTYVIGPGGAPLTFADLPQARLTYWTPVLKAEVVAAVRGGLLTLEEACRRYKLIVEEFLEWQRALDRYGLAGLRTTRSQQYRN